MNYQKIYNNIINNAQSLNRKRNKKLLFEKHHIIPKSLGGSNEKSNLVLLTPKEHYICHRLLVEIYKGTNQENKMYYAMWCMINGLGNQKRHATSSRIYNNLKIKLKEIRSKDRYDNRKTIEQYDQKGNYIQKFDSPKTAAKLLGISNTSIENCAREKSKTAGGFNWKYTNSNKIIKNIKYKKSGVKKGNIPWNKNKLIEPGTIKVVYKKVEQYTKNGVFIKEYERVDLASKSTGISRSSIENCCLNKSKTAGGFNWKYVNSNKIIIPIQYEKPGVKKNNIPWNKKQLQTY